MKDLTVKLVSVGEPSYQQVYDLREEILRKPIGLSLKDEDLSADLLDIIVTAEHNDTIIGCVMIHPLADCKALKLRQMAVVSAWRGKGVGRLLVEAAEKICWRKGAEKIILHARVTAKEFYSKMHYKITSDIFIEVGIPHVIMEKNKP